MSIPYCLLRHGRELIDRQRIKGSAVEVQRENHFLNYTFSVTRIPLQTRRSCGGRLSGSVGISRHSKPRHQKRVAKRIFGFGAILALGWPGSSPQRTPRKERGTCGGTCGGTSGFPPSTCAQTRPLGGVAQT